MGTFLRVTLACIFIGYGVFSFLNPQSVKEYLDLRYKRLYSVLVEEASMTKHFTGSLINAQSAISKYMTTVLSTLTGIFALFGFRRLFRFFALKFALLGVLLHLPYTKIKGSKEKDMWGESIEVEIKKLMFFGALFCAVLLYRPNKGDT